jgi:hypothetical protein
VATRTTRSQVTFSHPFTLPEVGEALPAGTYDIDTDEEMIEGNARTVYVRRATLIHVRGLGTSRIVTIDPVALDSALSTDGARDDHPDRTVPSS